VSEFSFEPFAPGPRDARAQVFSELRERGPVYHTDSDLWVVSRFDEVKAVNSSPELFSSRPNPYEGDAEQMPQDEDPELMDRIVALAADMPIDLDLFANSRAIAGADPPEHTRMRRIVSRGFTPPRIAEMATAIDEIVSRCLEPIHTSHSFDVVERLAIPLPVEMICHILGIPRDNYGDVKRWSDAFAGAAVGDLRRSLEGQLLLLRTLRDFSTFFVPLIEARRIDPQGDLISTMVQAIDDEALTTVETITMFITIMVAGNETSTNLIGNTAVELLANPEQLDRLVQDPSLLPNAIEEANRFTAPIQFTFREATEETEIAGTRIPKGAIVVLHLAAANRDPRQFENPEQFRVDRPLGKNVSFGHGIHFCLGAHLAGQEVRTAIGGLLPWLKRSRLGDLPLEPNPSVLLNGWRKVELIRD
jgi:cytochrome P450